MRLDTLSFRLHGDAEAPVTCPLTVDVTPAGQGPEGFISSGEERLPTIQDEGEAGETESNTTQLDQKRPSCSSGPEDHETLSGTGSAGWGHVRPLHTGGADAPQPLQDPEQQGCGARRGLGPRPWFVDVCTQRTDHLQARREKTRSLRQHL